MPYFQNVFEVSLTLTLYDVNFKINGNVNSSQAMTAWNPAPWNLSMNNTLTLNYSFDSGRHYTALGINIASGASSSSAVTAEEVVAALLANATFAALFTAVVNQDNRGNKYVVIKALRQRTQFRAYVSNSSAESILRFNKKAGVAELPSYFSRHTIANANEFSDSLASLIELSNPVSGVDQAIVTDAGLDYSTVQEDWELFGGRSDKFMFRKITVDGSDRITQILEYPAGSMEGASGKRIDYVYTGANTQPDQITEIPFVISSGDLITP